MKITTRITWSMITGEVLEHETYEYDGPVALCDRAAQNAAKTAASTAGTVAGTEGTNAQGEEAQLTPFFERNMNATHGFDPSQTNELLTAAGSSAGAAEGDLSGRLNDEAARTRNASGFTKGLDELQRDKNKALGGASEQIAGEDVMGAKKLNEEGAAGLSGLYGTNTGAMLKAMGQQNEDVNTQVNAGKTGWLQNMDQTIASLTAGAKSGAQALGYNTGS